MKKASFATAIFVLSIVFSWVSIVGTVMSQEKPIELNFAYWSSPKAKTAQLFKEMLDRIEKRSNGRIKFNAYFGETLLKISESYRGVQLDVADMSYFGPGIPGNPIVLGKIMSLPFLGITSMEMTTDVYKKLAQECPEINEEYKGIRVMGATGIPLDNLNLTNKPVHVPKDMEGMKIIALGARVRFLKDAGAIPVTIGVGEWYTSLERGLAEGLYFLLPAIPIFRLEDQFKYHTMINATACINMFIFNEKKWRTIPPDLQEIIIEGTEWKVREGNRRDNVEQARVLAELKEKGHEIYYPTPEQMKEWHAVAKPTHEEWIEAAEKKGLPGRKVYDKLMEIIAEYNKNKK